MVDLFRQYDNSTFKTQLTEGMLRSILVTDPLPCTTISLLRRFISAVLLIIAVAQLLMLFTEPFVCQLRASGIRAWVLRFPWHHSTFFPIEKAATVFCSATALSSFAFASLTLSHRLTVVPNLILLYCFRNHYFIQGIPVKTEYIIDSITKFNGDLFPSHIGQIPQFQYRLKLCTLHCFAPANDILLQFHKPHHGSLGNGTDRRGTTAAGQLLAGLQPNDHRFLVGHRPCRQDHHNAAYPD